MARPRFPWPLPDGRNPAQAADARRIAMLCGPDSEDARHEPGLTFVWGNTTNPAGSWGEGSCAPLPIAAASSLRLLALCFALGGLEWVQHGPGDCFLLLNVSGEVAGAEGPFSGGIRIARTIASAIIGYDTSAPHALLHDRSAATSIERAAFPGHEGALHTWLQGYAVQRNHPLSWTQA